MTVYSNDYTKYKYSDNGILPTGDDGSITTEFANLQKILNKSAKAGSLFSNTVVSTYSLAYTYSGAYEGGVLDLNGNLHFCPSYSGRGQKN